MSEYKFEFRFEKDQLSPDTMSFFDLGPFLSDFSAAVLAESKKAGLDLAQIQDSLHLVSITKGSVRLSFNSDSEMINDSTRSVILAFKDEYPGIPSSATIQLVKRSAKLCQEHDMKLWCEGSIVSEDSVLLADASYQMPAFKMDRITENTWIYGTLVDIGGKTSTTAQIVSLEGISHYCELSRELAQKMANHLYGSMLRLNGNATYTQKDKWILDSFEVQSFSVMKSTGIVAAIDAIKPYLQDKYNAIDDINKYIDQGRH